MEVILAEHAGFCFGVQRAVDTVYQQIENSEKKGRPIYTFGPIIHNEEVVSDLQRRGVRVLDSLAAAGRVSEEERGTVIIRSHGVEKIVCENLKELGFEVVDATCPFVKRIHNIVEKESAAGKSIVIVGNEGHPEVEGIRGWSESATYIVGAVEEARNLVSRPGEELCIVSQTTFNYKKFQDVVEIFAERGYNGSVVNTVCNAAEVRQAEARELAARVDVMIVIGGNHSSNTRKLYEICRQECEMTYYIQTLDDLHEGTVIDVKPEEIILNIGYKSDGVLTRNEYTNEPNVDLTTIAKPGDTMEVKVLKVNDGEGQVLLTYKRLAADRGNKRIEEAYENREVLTAKVAQVLDGGLSVIVEEVRIFIPASLVSDTYEKDLTKYAGQEIQFVISEYNPKRRRYIGDRKQLILEEKAEMQKKLFETIKIGDTVEGTVKNVTDFGAFIDLGGCDGLLHISEMSWGRVENPKKVFKVGDVVKVLIKDISGTKIALSLKFEDQNPWRDAASKYAVGTEVTGRVARMTDFGAFIELEPGIDALLHVSQISKEHIDKPSDVLKSGEEVTAKVVDFNEADRKISLSIKAMFAAEPKAEKAADEDVVSVDIDAVIAGESEDAE